MQLKRRKVEVCVSMLTHLMAAIVRESAGKERRKSTSFVDCDEVDDDYPFPDDGEYPTQMEITNYRDYLVDSIVELIESLDIKPD